ncbi:MAG TPA: fimbrial protein [Scandinavium sp.]|jgi:major type 1 subunit fimbrin (pilin)
MKKLAILSALLGGMFIQGAFAAADGTITFNGTITDSPCTVASSSINQTVQMGQIKTSAVTGADGTDLGSKTPFNIDLQNCSPTLKDGTTTWTKMQVMFTDNIDPANTSKVLVNSGTGIGVSVGLLNSADSSEITLGTASKDLLAVPSVSGQSLPFYAHFVKAGAGAGSAGDIIAKADFQVSYN